MEPQAWGYYSSGGNLDQSDWWDWGESKTRDLVNEVVDEADFLLSCIYHDHTSLIRVKKDRRTESPIIQESLISTEGLQEDKLHTYEPISITF